MRLSRGRENVGEKMRFPPPFPSSDAALHTLIKRMKPAFYTTLCPHKDLSKRSQPAGQSNAADLSASVAAQWTCRPTGSGLLLLSKYTDFLKYMTYQLPLHCTTRTFSAHRESINN